MLVSSQEVVLPCMPVDGALQGIAAWYPTKSSGDTEVWLSSRRDKRCVHVFEDMLFQNEAKDEHNMKSFITTTPP